jgi:hypothetical protein
MPLGRRTDVRRVTGSDAPEAQRQSPVSGDRRCSTASSSCCRDRSSRASPPIRSSSPTVCPPTCPERSGIALWPRATVRALTRWFMPW